VGVSEKMYRVTVAEAAARLGVKEQAIRKRIQRGTLTYDKDDDGRVYVYLDMEDRATGTDADAGINTLLQSLQDQSCTYGKRPRTGRRRPAAKTPLS